MRHYLSSNAAIIWSLYIFMYDVYWVLHSMEVSTIKAHLGKSNVLKVPCLVALNYPGGCITHAYCIFSNVCTCKLPRQCLTTLNVWKWFYCNVYISYEASVAFRQSQVCLYCLEEWKMAIGMTGYSHGFNLVPTQNKVETWPDRIAMYREGCLLLLGSACQRSGNESHFRQAGPVSFETMVRNSESGEVSSLHCYFNKHLVSVVQLNSLLNTYQQSGQVVPQVAINIVTCLPVAKHRSHLMMREIKGSRRIRGQES